MLAIFFLCLCVSTESWFSRSSCFFNVHEDQSSDSSISTSRRSLLCSQCKYGPAVHRHSRPPGDGSYACLSEEGCRTVRASQKTTCSESTDGCPNFGVHRFLRPSKNVHPFPPRQEVQFEARPLPLYKHAEAEAVNRLFLHTVSFLSSSFHP